MVVTLFRTIDGVNYTVRLINSIGMRNQWKRGGLEPQLKNLIQEMSLDEVDVVAWLLQTGMNLFFPKSTLGFTWSVVGEEKHC